MDKIARLPSRVFLVTENAVSFWLAAFSLLFIMFFIAIEIISRRTFNYSFMGVVDMVELGVLILVFAALSGIQRDNSHIIMDLVPNKFQGKRVGFIIQLTNLALTFAVALVLSYVAVKAALTTYQNNVVTLAVLLPLWPAAMFIPIGFFLLCIRLGIQIKQFIASKPGY